MGPHCGYAAIHIARYLTVFLAFQVAHGDGPGLSIGKLRDRPAQLIERFGVFG